jgi:4-hydroxy-tetrahydrodipicolinate synthase
MRDRLPRGVVAAACTPIGPDGRPDLPRFIRHAERLRSEGCAGILIAGSTGEGSAFTLSDRRDMLTRLTGEFTGWPMVASTGAPSVGDTAALTRHAIDTGATPLILPPPVSGPVDDDGVIEWYMRVIEETHESGCAIVLHNPPEATGVRLSAPLVARLVAQAGTAIVGLKDSSGDRTYISQLRQKAPTLQLYVGHEPLLVDALRLGANGAMCGLANLVAPLLIATLSATLSGDDDRAEAGGLAITLAWTILSRRQPFPMAFKALIALREADTEWARMMPPLRQMDEEVARLLAADLEGVPQGADI